MTNAVAQLAIRLLGTPEIQVAGEPLLTLHNYKARALLFYLAATGQSHTRDHLATLLWSEAPDSNARHSLRSSLYHLRQALQAKGVGDVLVGDGDLVYLRSDDDGCDVSRFHRLIATESESALAEAVSLYHGPLLQGFTLPDAPVFEEWVRFEGARLNHAYLGALQRLASRSETRQSWEEAIGYVQRIVQVDPLAEETQQRLISLYLRIGAIGLALRQYRQFETELSHELGLTPSLDTQALLDEALRTQRSTPSLTKTSPHLSENFPETLPFIGRDNALNKLLAITQDTITTGHGTTVLLQGENGVGKSRLVDGLVASLLVEAHPWIILKGSCSPFDDLLPYGPFLEALQSAALGDLTDLLTRSHEVGPGEQGEFAWRVLQALRMLSHSAPLLIAIDDLQWANSSTLQLFGFLATKLRSMPVMLLGTMQDVESIPALQRLITVGRRHGDVHVLSLEPLTQGAVSDLLQASALSSSSIVTLTEWLYERSGGNPFILMEILTQLRTEAILIPAGAGWRLETGRWLRWRSTHALPETIHDLVNWRLANLSSDARYLLEVFAVADQPLPLALLTDFPGVRSEHLVSILDDLLARRLVIEAANERLVLSHSLIRETLVYRLSHFRRRTIHRQLVEILEACPALRKDFPLRQIALHAVAAQDLERARRYGLQFLVELSQDYASAEVVDFLHQLYDLLTPTASLDEMLRLTHTLGNFHQ
jgi:DNA-binding SARP family transcriptional activator